ncbi:MAG: type II toxin-antitoxin system VapB family antitoxin [Spirosomataceae bacterium]
MRTNIDLDDKLVEELMQLSQIRTKKELIHAALKEYKRRLNMLELSKLWGSNIWEGDLNEMRTEPTQLYYEKIDV